MAQKDKIVEYRGCECLFVARVLKDDADGITFDTPEYLAGASEISRKIESSTETKYYDNGPAIIASGVSAPEFTLSVSALSNEKLAYITGFSYDTAQDALDLGDYDPVDIALMYKYQTDDNTAYYGVIYKGRFAIPEVKSATRTAEAGDGTGIELTYTASKTTHAFTKTGKPGLGTEYMCPGDDVTKSKVDLSKFFDTVMTPDTATLNKAEATE